MNFLKSFVFYKQYFTSLWDCQFTRRCPSFCNPTKDTIKVLYLEETLKVKDNERAKRTFFLCRAISSCYISGNITIKKKRGKMHVQQHVLFCLLPCFLMRLCNGLEIDLGTTATWRVKSSTQDLEVSNVHRQL